jgi:predicted  nucleic acid-binding Zn-ribbon protein
MTTNGNSKFKMQTDDEKPDFQSQEEIDDFQVEKLSKRVTRISILIPCLIFVITLAVYFDLKKSISLTDSTGILGVKALSKELESKFSSLSLRQANLEDDLTKRIEAIEKSTASIQANLNKATTAIKYIRSARTTDNKKFESTIATIDNKLSPLPGDLETMASDLKNIDNTVDNKLANISQIIGSAKKDLINIRADIDSLKSVTVDKKSVDVLLKNQQEAYQLALQKITRNLEDKIESVEKKLKEQEKGVVHQKPKPEIIIEKNVR